jgi:hypothetical protein
VYAITIVQSELVGKEYEENDMRSENIANEIPNMTRVNVSALPPS